VEQLINVANVLYLLSYFVHRILWLRILTVAAASFLTLYFYRLPEPLMAAVYWNLGFIALNALWILRLACPILRARRRAQCPLPAPIPMDSGSWDARSL